MERECDSRLITFRGPMTDSAIIVAGQDVPSQIFAAREFEDASGGGVCADGSTNRNIVMGKRSGVACR